MFIYSRPNAYRLYCLTLALFLLVLPLRPIFAEDGPVIIDPVDIDSPDNLNEEDPVLNENSNIENPPEEELPPTAPPPPPEETPGIAPTDLQKGANKPLSADPTSGALLYSYDLKVPPGRNGLTPDLKLNYNSQNANLNGPVGSGWSLSIPYIERFNKEGIDKLFTTDYYSSSLSGELTKVSATSYIAKTEDGSFFKYTFSNNIWTVVDKTGTIYTFGSSASGRQDDPNDSSKIYKWMLQEIRDTNDNYVKYEYYKNTGEIYPEKITYTGNGTTDGIFTINFIREARTNAPVSYSTGFKTQSNYRISEIRADINGVWVKKYAFTYTTADSGTGSLLDTIVESGQNGSIITTLPAVDFDYKKSTAGWTYDSSFNLPLPFINYISVPEFGMRMADINGDGLADILVSRDLSTQSIWLNTGTGFTNVSSTWSFPTRPYSVNSQYSPTETFVNRTGLDNGLRLLDINGDNLVDLVRGDGNLTNNYVYLNNGSGWTYDSSFNLPIPFINYYNVSDPGMRMGDINGDGLPDILVSKDLSTQSIWLNTGTGFTNVSSTWSFPTRAYSVNQNNYSTTETFVNRTGADMGLRLVDINGDGLTDLVRGDEGASNYPGRYVYLNTGSGWVYDSLWYLPIPFINYNGLQDFGMRMGDINGDGLPDITLARDMNNSNVWLNTGTGFTNVSSTWSFPTRPYYVDPINHSATETYISNNGVDRGSRLMDVNGDNVSDLIRGDGNITNNYIYLSNTKSQVNLLSKITYTTGGNTEVTYKPSPLYKDSSNNLSNSKLPLVVDTVYKITDTSGSGPSSTNEYFYENGSYYFNTPRDRKFAGFGKVTKIDPVGNVTKTYYHQGNTTDTAQGEYADDVSKIGRSYRTETFDNANNLYSVTVNKWDKTNVSTGSDFVYQTARTELTYDGGSSHKDKAETYTYDTANGNLLTDKNWGEVIASTDGTFTDTGTDISESTLTYASNTSLNILGLPSAQTKKDQNANIVNQTRYYYDSLPIGSVGTGNQTKVEKWVASSNYVNTQKAYNSYGLPTSSTDERGKVTNYSYDSSNLYPASITNPLSQVISYTYDYASGKATTIVDPNSRTFTTVYDGLGRILEEKQPDEINPSHSVTKTTYVYNDTSGAVSIKKTDYLDSTNGVDSYTYFDGLGRKIQERTETEVSNVYNVKDYTYNSRGLLDKESLPYANSGAGITPQLFGGPLVTSYSYDALGRIVASTNAVGTTTNAYDDWTVTTTDANSKVKKYYRDVYNNLTQVDEVSGSSTYSTYYKWDLNGKLTKITDALGNIRNFSYDGLGRKLTAEDLHAPSDMLYGHYTYTYDNAGNLTSTLDPNSQTTNYTYDDLNRVLTEDFTGATGTEITYTYDTATHNGKGRPKSATMASVNTEYDYSPTGQVITEIRTISGTPYTTSYTYDRQGNKLTITYPDNSSVAYTYNIGGLLETIAQKENGVLSYTNVLTNINYSPTNQPTVLAYQNGQTTTNTYDANHLYRLSSKRTVSTTSPMLQNLNYTYDAVGNITQIVDTTMLASAKTMTYTYDDLHRLTQATATLANPAGPGNYTENYTYNAIGNILTKTGTAGTYSYAGNTGTSYANPHAVTSIGAKNYTYDNNGNLLTETGGNTYIWNYKNQLAQTTTAAPSIIATYSYDHNGDRVLYNDGTTTIIYPNQYYNVSGTNIAKQVYAGNELILTVDNTPTLNTRHYVHTDHIMGSNVVSDSTGALEQLLDYYPYGTQRVNISNTAFDEQHKFTGKEHDSLTNLDYFGARYYYSDIGRFVSEDSIFWNLSEKYLLDPQQQNSYSYARNNPIKYIDPDGNSAVDVINNFVSNMLARTYSPSFSTSAQTQKTTTWDSLTNTRIASLDQRLQQPATNFINNTETELGVKLRVNEGFRSNERQDELYAQSRTQDELNEVGLSSVAARPDLPRVTNAKGGESYHNYGLALDVVIVENSKENWNKAISPEIANIGISQGFTWGGSFSSIKDFPHFQMTFGQSTKTLKEKSKKP